MDTTNTVYLEYALVNYPAVSHYMRALKERHFNVMTEPKLDTPYILVIMVSQQWVAATIAGDTELHQRPSRPPERTVVVRMDGARPPQWMSAHRTIYAGRTVFNITIDHLEEVLRSFSSSSDIADTGTPNDASIVESAPATSTKPGVFISHHRSPDEDTFTSRLKDDLEAAGVVVWVDTKKLTPRTADWERKIRKAIAQADVLIYVGTEAAKDSPYVRDELSIADEEDVQIIRLWAQGEKWLQCVPLGRGVGQRIDMRGEKYESGFQQLIESLMHPEEDV